MKYRLPRIFLTKNELQTRHKSNNDTSKCPICNEIFERKLVTVFRDTTNTQRIGCIDCRIKLRG